MIYKSIEITEAAWRLLKLEALRTDDYVRDIASKIISDSLKPHVDTTPAPDPDADQ